MKDEELVNHVAKLDEASTNLVADIINETDLDRTKDIIKAFNLNIAKKNALRSVKLNGLLDDLTDLAAERVRVRPDQLSNKELLDFINTVQNQADKSAGALNTIDNIPAIQINSQKNEININMQDNGISSLSSESRRKALDAVTKILEMAKASENSAEDDGIIDVEVKNDKD